MDVKDLLPFYQHIEALNVVKHGKMEAIKNARMMNPLSQENRTEIE
jgi:hypothetical protein